MSTLILAISCMVCFFNFLAASIICPLYVTTNGDNERFCKKALKVMGIIEVISIYLIILVLFIERCL